MFYASSKLSRLAAIRVTLDRADHLDDDLVRSIIVHTSGRDPMPILNVLEPLIAARAWTDVGLSIIARQLPDWCVRRLYFDDGLWWCGINPRQPVYWAPCEVDEPHPVLPIAVLKAYVSALIQRDCATTALPGDRIVGTNYVPAHCE